MARMSQGISVLVFEVYRVSEKWGNRQLEELLSTSAKTRPLAFGR